MPYSRDDAPAAWWAGADPTPPMPEGEGPWALGPTPYGWAWRRSEPDAPDEAAGAPDTHGLSPAETREWVAAYEAGTPFGHRDAPWNKGAVQVHAGGGGGIGPHAFPAGGSYVVGAGGVRHEPAPVAPDAVFDARVAAVVAALPDAIEHGRDDADTAAQVLRAADAVPDPRREAERRVVEAAREWWRTAVERYGDPDSAARAAEPQPCDLRDALAVLAALDGEGGG